MNQIEIVEGLQPGDQVILSDMSAQDSFDRDSHPAVSFECDESTAVD